MVDYEKARDSLSDLRAWADANVSDEQRNEASTRFHLIDRLFVECLAD